MLKINKKGLTGFLGGPSDELTVEGGLTGLWIQKYQSLKIQEEKENKSNLEVISYLAKERGKKYDNFIVSEKTLSLNPSFW